VKHAAADGSRWCIVVADDHRADRAIGLGRHPAPVQYCRLGEGATLLQRALHRAAETVPSSQVLVSAFEEYRDLWEPSVWFIRPEKRFVSVSPQASQLAVAAAILSVAAHSTSDVITILPARCYVTHERILRRAMNHALAELPGIPEGAVTLGMLDREEGVDEDYLLVGRARDGRGLRVDGFARQPVPWVARHLRQHGALVASGILIGYAGVFAAHISKHWPGVSKKLAQLTAAAGARGEECKIPSVAYKGDPPALPHSLRWRPSAFRQRVIGVCHSGWSGLKSPQSVARMVEFLSNRAEAEMNDGIRVDEIHHATEEIDATSYGRGDLTRSMTLGGD
jgi:mannose-1-phosphate guanylyltransferase